jgi:hypothetical protein
LALKSDAKRREHPLQDGGKTDQHDKDFEQICQPAIAHKPIDYPEQDRADDNDDEYVNQDKYHDNLAKRRLTDRLPC